MGFKEVCKDLSNKKILIAEDADYILNLMQDTFGKITDKLFIAKNGKEGIEIFDKENPDIVITDIRMPIVNGEELIKHAKEKNSNTIIMAVTAFADEFKDKNLADGIFIKPINMINLIEDIHKLALNK